MPRHLLIIGAQRCGTTALATRLDLHPDIAMARPSRPEPKVFLSPGVADRGIDWYRNTYFAHATTEHVLGDKSTSYLEHPQAAAVAARIVPDALILAQLRDPVARAVSNWRFSTDNDLEARPLAQALRDNLHTSAAWDASVMSVSPFAYLERGRYADLLEPWFDAFPGAVRVQFLEELLADEAVMRDLFRWLGVASPPATEHHIRRENASSTPPSALDDDLIEALHAYYEASDERLAERIGQKPPWAGP